MLSPATPNASHASGARVLEGVVNRQRTPKLAAATTHDAAEKRASRAKRNRLRLKWLSIYPAPSWHCARRSVP